MRPQERGKVELHRSARRGGESHAGAASAAGRTLHFVRYLPDQTSAVYRRTADASHAALTIQDIPATISDRACEIAVNLTVFAAPFGRRHVVRYAAIGKNRFVYLFAL